MDWLKKLLGDDVYAKLTGSEIYKEIEAKLKDAKVLVDDGSLIPKYRLDEYSDKIKSLTSQVEDRDKQIAGLKESAKGNEDLVKEIDTLQKQNKAASEEFVKKEADIKKQFALKEALLNSGVMDADARELLIPKFPLDKIELEGEKIKGFDDMLKPIKENKTLASLFTTTEIQGTKHQEGEKNKTKGETLTTKEWVKEIFEQ